MRIPEELSVLTNFSPPLARKSVLLIDDDEDILTLLRTVLEMDDYEVFTARGASEALKALSKISRPDLIFLDVQMDDVSGPDFLLALEEKMPAVVKEVPVVFLTGFNEVPKSKSVGFIRKPIDIDTFLKDTQRFIETGTGYTRNEH